MRKTGSVSINSLDGRDRTPSLLGFTLIVIIKFPLTNKRKCCGMKEKKKRKKYIVK